MVLVMLEDVSYDNKQVEQLKSIFTKFDTDGGGYVTFSELPDMMAQFHHNVFPTPEEIQAKMLYYAADETMTMTWDEFLLLMYDHGPVVGELSSFHTHTPLKKNRRALV